MSTANHQIDCRLLGPFDLDASSYRPRPRGEATSVPPHGLEGQARSRARLARDRWLAVLRRHTKAGEGGSWSLAEEGWQEGSIEVWWAPEGSSGARGSPQLVVGTAVLVDSPEHLGVYERKAEQAAASSNGCEEERLTYLAWEDVLRISFTRQRPRGSA